ncbi:MAG: response regulator [Nitrospiraceae bacterium]
MIMRVLVVDDQEDIRKSVRLSLTKAGFEVIEAEDGEKGIQMVSRGNTTYKLGAIICDIRMPKISGVEAITYFRQQFPSTPVIVLTGYPEVQLSVDLMKKGVVDFLEKPVSPEKLVAAVQKAINERTWGPQDRKTVYP